MKILKYFSRGLLLGLALPLLACGNQDNQKSKAHVVEEPPVHRDDATSDDATSDDAEGPCWCSAKHSGFTVKYAEGTIIQNATQRNGYLQFSGIDVAMAYDSYLKREAPESYPYNYILVEIFAEDGKNYPIVPGTYKLGTTESERNVHTCLNCVTLGVDTNKKNTPQKKLFAITGEVTVTAIEEGKLQASLKKAYFKEYSEEFDDKGEPLSATFVENGEDWCVDSATFDGTSFFVYKGN